jgi:hypothetical protein
MLLRNLSGNRTTAASRFFTFKNLGGNFSANRGFYQIVDVRDIDS